VIKHRTIKVMSINHSGIIAPCQTNYATDYAILEHMYSIFSNVWHDLGYTWDDFLTWSDQRHVPSMQVTHVEIDHAQNHVRR
jgi:hypothetical protein